MAAPSATTTESQQIFVSGIPFSVSKSEFETFVREQVPSSAIEEVTLLMHGPTKNKGFGFVRFTSRDAAASAIGNSQKWLLQGAKLSLRFSGNVTSTRATVGGPPPSSSRQQRQQHHTQVERFGGGVPGGMATAGAQQRGRGHLQRRALAPTTATGTGGTLGQPTTAPMMMSNGNERAVGLPASFDGIAPKNCYVKQATNDTTGGGLLAQLSLAQRQVVHRHETIEGREYVVLRDAVSEESTGGTAEHRQEKMAVAVDPIVLESVRMWLVGLGFASVSTGTGIPSSSSERKRPREETIPLLLSTTPTGTSTSAAAPAPILTPPTSTASRTAPVVANIDTDEYMVELPAKGLFSILAQTRTGGVDVEAAGEGASSTSVEGSRVGRYLAVKSPATGAVMLVRERGDATGQFHLLSRNTNQQKNDVVVGDIEEC